MAPGSRAGSRGCARWRTGHYGNPTSQPGSARAAREASQPGPPPLRPVAQPPPPQTGHHVRGGGPAVVFAKGLSRGGSGVRPRRASAQTPRESPRSRARESRGEAPLRRTRSPRTVCSDRGRRSTRPLSTEGPDPRGRSGCLLGRPEWWPDMSRRWGVHGARPPTRRRTARIVIRPGPRRPPEDWG